MEELSGRILPATLLRAAPVDVHDQVICILALHFEWEREIPALLFATGRLLALADQIIIAEKRASEVFGVIDVIESVHMDRRERPALLLPAAS